MEMLTALHQLPLPPGCRVRVLSPASVPEGAYTQWCTSVRQTLQDEGTLADLFWWQQHIPDEAKGSLDDIMILCRNGLVLTLDYAAPETPERFTGAGIAVLSDIIPGQKAQVTVWYARGVVPQALKVPITRAVAQWVFATMEIPLLWAQRISPREKNHFLTCGAEVWASIPDFAWHRGRTHTVEILRLTAKGIRHAEGKSDV